MPSSPIPGRPATLTLTPIPPNPAAAMWLLSFSSGLQGGECCLCYSDVSRSAERKIREAAYIFESVKILVALATNLAFVRLLLFHTQSTRVRGRCFWIYNREGTISILMQLLGLVTVCLVISVSLLALAT
jgi:hypothetical protein